MCQELDWYSISEESRRNQPNSQKAMQTRTSAPSKRVDKRARYKLRVELGAPGIGSIGFKRVQTHCDSGVVEKRWSRCSSGPDMREFGGKCQ